MNKQLYPYYISRIIFSTAFGILLYVNGMVAWQAILFTVVLVLLFILSPLSGRYSVHPEFGIFALRRDERTQVINDRAARNAFVACMLAVAAAIVFFPGYITAHFGIVMLKWLLRAGVVVYCVSDIWLRRSYQ
ncbi:MAG: hypothetical protein HPY76_13835 [Anaerolineae bacterium]|jgi:UPF0716 family protein affecting phage T7 exclusion|nr:hypothetical protein [Anaerolineae bacterium]